MGGWMGRWMGGLIDGWMGWQVNGWMGWLIDWIKLNYYFNKPFIELINRLRGYNTLCVVILHLEKSLCQNEVWSFNTDHSFIHSFNSRTDGHWPEQHKFQRIRCPTNPWSHGTIEGDWAVNLSCSLFNEPWPAMRSQIIYGYASVW